jgi:hypothetical protein
LIPIIANHYSCHSIFQNQTFTNLFNTDAKKLIFRYENNVLCIDDNYLKNIDNRIVSRNIGELFQGTMKYENYNILYHLNINSLTADFTIFMMRIGIPIQLIIAFLNQPIIRLIVSLYYQFEQNTDELNKTLKNLNSTYDSPKKDLFENGLSYDELIENLRDENHAIQSSVLVLFKSLAPIAKKLARLSNLIKIETKYPNNIFDIKRYYENFKSLPIEYTSKESKINMLYYFNELSFNNAQEKLIQFFPYANPIYSTVKNTIAMNNKFKLNSQTDSLLNIQLIEFISKEYSLFNLSPNERNEIRTYFVNNFTSIKEEYSSIFFIQFLQIFEYKYNLIIGVDNFNTLSGNQESTLEDSFLVLSSINFDLAILIIRYCCLKRKNLDTFF